jgi:hypothetical protein
MAMAGAFSLLNVLLGKQSPHIARDCPLLPVNGNDEEITFRPNERRKIAVQKLLQ